MCRIPDFEDSPLSSHLVSCEPIFVPLQAVYFLSLLLRLSSGHSFGDCHRTWCIFVTVTCLSLLSFFDLSVYCCIISCFLVLSLPSPRTPDPCALVSSRSWLVLLKDCLLLSFPFEWHPVLCLCLLVSSDGVKSVICPSYIDISYTLKLSSLECFDLDFLNYLPYWYLIFQTCKMQL